MHPKSKDLHLYWQFCFNISLKKNRPDEAAEDYIDEIINMLLHINNNSQINIMDRSLGNKIVEKTSPISSSDNVQIHPIVENKTKVCTYWRCHTCIFMIFVI